MNDYALALQQAKFTAQELALFLDTQPDSAEALAAYRNAVYRVDEAEAAYDANVGPLTACDAGGKTWDWIETPWPWQKED